MAQDTKQLFPNGQDIYSNDDVLFLLNSNLKAGNIVNDGSGSSLPSIPTVPSLPLFSDASSILKSSNDTIAKLSSGDFTQFDTMKPSASTAIVSGNSSAGAPSATKETGKSWIEYGPSDLLAWLKTGSVSILLVLCGVALIWFALRNVVGQVRSA